MKNKFKKIIYLIVSVIMILQSLSSVVMATTEISKANLKKDHSIKTNLQYKASDGTWHNIICNYIAYTTGGTKYPAYCIKHGVNGVDEEGSYTVKISKLLSDNKIWRTIINGYPYKTPAEIGVETKDDAYLATKQAVYSVMLNRDVKSYYKGTNAKGKKVVKAIYNLSEIGKHGTQTMQDANLRVEKASKLTKYDNSLYYQEYKAISDVNISTYSVEKISGFPDGSYIADTTGKGKTNFNAGENFRIMIPKKNMNSNFTGTIDLKGKCKTYPIFFGTAPKSNIQDYAITYDAYGDFSATASFEEKINDAKINIIKKDEDSSKPIKGVKFSLSLEGKVIETKETDSEGKITFENLFPGLYELEEVETNKNYILDIDKQEIKIELGETVVKEITNKHKKGSLKILKVDKDDNNITLDGIEFDLIDENKQVVAHVKTDENGQAEIKDINIGNYTLKETKTKKEYNLCIDKNIVVKWDETTEVTIENEKKKGQIKVIKIDKDNNEIKLKGVEFEVLDSKNKVVEKLITDEKGEAITSRLPIGEYKIKEVSLGKNFDYILNDESYTVEVTDKVIKDLKIENERKKGKISIVKTSSGDSPELNIKKGQPLQGVVFEIFDSNNNLVDTLITDENGKATSKDLYLGKYNIKEKSTIENFLLNSNDFFVEIQKNKQIEILNIQNDPAVPELEIEKTGPDEVYKNEEIKYQFNLENKGNVELENFTWTEYLPYKQITLKRMSTGTYNENLNCRLYYKTNINDFILLREFNTSQNEYIDFTNIKLQDNEKIIQIKIEYDKVQVGFKNIISPEIFAKVDDRVKKDDKIINYTELTGNFNGKPLKDDSEWKTIVNEKKIEKKLPRTGC